MELLLKFNIFSLASVGWSFSGILFVVLILAICLSKWRKQTKYFLKIIGCLLVYVALPISAVFCAVNINGYLFAKGGIFGQIKQSFGINTGKVTSDTFEISELNLRLDENQEYSAIIRVDVENLEATIKLDKNKKYDFLVNGGLTTNNFMSTTGESIAFSADYTYNFKDFKNNEIIKDTLHISFAFNKKQIECRLSSNGGAVAQNLWRLYYKKNGMSIKFIESTYEKDPFTSYKVDYLLTDNYSYTKYYMENSVLDLPNIVGIKNWMIEDEVLTSEYIVTSDLIIRANFLNIEEIRENSDIKTSAVENGYMIYSPNYAGLVYLDKSSNAYHVVNANGYDWIVDRDWVSNYFFVTSYNVNDSDFIFETQSLNTYTFKEKVNKHYLFKDNSTTQILYSVKNKQGFYLYNTTDNTDAQIFEYGTWLSIASIETRSVVIFTEFGSYTTRVEYDFKAQEINLNPNLLVSVVYGVYKTADTFKIAYIDETTKHLYLYDVLRDKTSAIDASNQWEKLAYIYGGEEEIIFIRGYSSPVVYELTYNFKTGAKKIDSYQNGTITG